MLDLGDIERIVGFQTHLPPCSEDAYERLAKHHAKALIALRDEMQASNRYLGLIQHAARKNGDEPRFQDAVLNEKFRERAVAILNGVEQASPFWVDRTHGNGKGRKL